jgi:hypothetical protein
LKLSYLGGNANQFCPSFKGHDTKESMWFLIREQSKFHTQRVQRRVMENGRKIFYNYKKHFNQSSRTKRTLAIYRPS